MCTSSCLTRSTLSSLTSLHEGTLSSSPECGCVQRLEVDVMDECTPEERRDPEDVNCALARDRPLPLIFSTSILASRRYFMLTVEIG